MPSREALDRRSRNETITKLDGLYQTLKSKSTRNLARRYRPYGKQEEFHEMGSQKRERLFMAGNQLGKTWAGGMEMSYHLTGRYPKKWKGKIFDRPIVAWALGVSGESTRDNPQRILLGRGRDYGTGSIPGDALEHMQLARGVADLLDYVKVRHLNQNGEFDGFSYLYFKFYEKGRENLQGETVDAIWCDEEPPMDVYTECLTRTNAVMGPVWITFTPLKGMSEVVLRFINPKPEDMDGFENRGVVNMEINEVDHYSEEDKRAIIASYPDHEREARAKGIPMLGSGRIFPITEESIRFNVQQKFRTGFPQWYRHLAALDFGEWDHPTACVWMAYDQEHDTVYIYDCYKRNKVSIPDHASSIRARGKWIPVAWPHDGLKHTTHSAQDTGNTIKGLYQKEGLKMLRDRAMFEDKEYGVESGIMDMLGRFQTQRLVIADHLSDWFDEFRMYHRKDGQVVKLRDDLMAATRYGIMQLRFARTKGSGGYNSVSVMGMQDHDSI